MSINRNSAIDGAHIPYIFCEFGEKSKDIRIDFHQQLTERGIKNGPK
jgi:hypothetical protein